MRIGIDIDDVITDTSLAMKKYTDKYDNNSDIYNYIEEVMRGEMPTEEIKEFFRENSIDIFKNVTVKVNASEVIQELLNNGNEIFIITSRGDMKFKGSEQLTLEYLKLNKINYTRILFNSFEKAKICKDNNIDVMIDDSAKYCSEIKKQNMEAILFTSEVNKSSDVKLPRVKDWIELKEKIYAIQNNKLGV